MELTCDIITQFIPAVKNFFHFFGSIFSSFCANSKKRSKIALWRGAYAVVARGAVFCKYGGKNRYKSQRSKRKNKPRSAFLA
jgi:hypothetical protein